MKQSIVTLVRPRLSLSETYNQSNHLIEHVLMSRQRQRAIGLTDKYYADHVYFDDGYISELYCAEYYVVPSDFANTMELILLNHANQLFLDEINLKQIKHELINELDNNRSELAGIMEVIERLIFDKSSPAVQMPWFDSSKITKLRKRNILDIYHKFGKPFWICQLNYNFYQIPENLRIKKNKLENDIKQVYLFHPYQDRESTNAEIFIPINDEINRNQLLLYIATLTDDKFGIVEEGLKKLKFTKSNIFVRHNLYANAIQMSFSCQKGNAPKDLESVKLIFARYDSLLKKRVDIYKQRLINKYKLEWGDIREYALYCIEEAILGENNDCPEERIKRIRSINYDDLSNLNKKICNLINKQSISILINYGSKISKEILSR